MFRFLRCLTLTAVVVLAVGCGSSPDPKGGEQPKPQSDPAALAEGKQLILTSEPTGAKGVIDIRNKARNGDEVVVVGRVGGSTKPFTEGRASFLIVDPSLKPTAECDCPWDFCEYPKKELAAARLSVKFAAADGQTLKSGARETFDIKELSTVVVKGKVSRDDKNNVVVVASGIFVRPE